MVITQYLFFCPIQIHKYFSEHLNHISVVAVRGMYGKHVNMYMTMAFLFINLFLLQLDLKYLTFNKTAAFCIYHYLLYK